MLGRGTIGTIYEMPSLSFQTTRTLKAGQDADALRSEFNTAREIYSTYSKLEKSAKFLLETGARLPRVPLHRVFHDSNEKSFWQSLGPHISSKGVAGIEMDRIPPMPSAVGKMLIRRFFDVDGVEHALQCRQQDDALVQLFFGRSLPDFQMPTPRSLVPTRTTTKVTTVMDASAGEHKHTVVSSKTTYKVLPCDETVECGNGHSQPFLSTLLNFPAPLPILKQHLRTRTAGIVSQIAAGYAMMHWGSHLDGSGTEFVLGGGDKISTWMLDFDKCRHILFPSSIDKKALKHMIDRHIVPVLKEGGYTPRVGEEVGLVSDENINYDDDEPREKRHESENIPLWDVWKNTYIEVGRYCCLDFGRLELLDGPRIACESLESAIEMERMGLDGSDDLVLFEDDQAETVDLGWGSDDDGDDEDSDYSDEFLEGAYLDDSENYSDTSGEDKEDSPSHPEIDDLESPPGTITPPTDYDQDGIPTFSKVLSQSESEKHPVSSPDSLLFLLGSFHFDHNALRGMELEDPNDDEELIMF